MAKQTWAEMRDLIEQKLQDTGNAVFSTAELDLYIPDGLVEISEYAPYIRRETYTIESRTGTATSTTTSALADATEAQFVSGDVGKVIFNDTDNTFAAVTAFVSSSQLTLSKDIMASGEQYRMFNKGCRGNREINLEDLGDGLWRGGHRMIDAVVYPTMSNLRRYRDWEVDGDILRIDLGFAPDDSKLTGANKEIYVYYAARHRLSIMTDLAGAVNNGSGYSAGDTSMAIDALNAAEVVTADDEFTIANLRGVYRVTADVTLSSGAGTISFYPGLESDVGDDIVITFSQGSLDPTLERLLADLVAGKAAMEKGSNHLNAVNVGGAQAWRDYLEWGRNKYDSTIAVLQAPQKPKSKWKWRRGGGAFKPSNF